MRCLAKLHGLAGWITICAAALLLAPGHGRAAAEIAATTPTIQTAPQTGTPGIQVEPAKLDLGELPEGALAPFTYTIRNTGDAPLQILDIKPTCGCTNVEMTEKTIPPGQSANLTGSFNTQARVGRQLKSIILTTNDPSHKTLNLEFTAHVYQDIAVEPTYLMLGTVLRQTGIEKRIRIRAWTDPPLEIKKIRVVEENQPIEVKLLDRKVDLREGDIASTGPLTTIDLSVTVPKGAPITILGGKIELQTNDKNKPSLWIPFQGRISGDVYANPTRVYFGAAEPGVTLTKVVTLTSRSEQPFAIESLDPGKYGVTMKPLTQGEQVVHQIELSMKIPDDGERRFRDDITLKIEHPTMSALELQVTAIARVPRPANLGEKIGQARQKEAQEAQEALKALDTSASQGNSNPASEGGK